MSNGVYVPPGAANGEVKPVVSGTPLVDFLLQLEDYTPTVRAARGGRGGRVGTERGSPRRSRMPSPGIT